MDNQTIMSGSEPRNLTKTGELKNLEETQLVLLSSINLILKKHVETYLKQQKKNILNERGEVRDEVITNIVLLILDNTKDVILNQHRVKKMKNKEKITAKDLDEQLHQANLFN